MKAYKSVGKLNEIYTVSQKTDTTKPPTIISTIVVRFQ